MKEEMGMPGLPYLYYSHASSAAVSIIIQSFEYHFVWELFLTLKPFHFPHLGVLLAFYSL